jgi:hypothetical protein
LISGNGAESDQHPLCAKSAIGLTAVIDIVEGMFGIDPHIRPDADIVWIRQSLRPRGKIATQADDGFAFLQVAGRKYAEPMDLALCNVKWVQRTQILKWLFKPSKIHKPSSRNKFPNEQGGYAIIHSMPQTSRHDGDDLNNPLCLFVVFLKLGMKGNERQIIFSLRPITLGRISMSAAVAQPLPVWRSRIKWQAWLFPPHSRSFAGFTLSLFLFF